MLIKAIIIICTEKHGIAALEQIARDDFPLNAIGTDDCKVVSHDLQIVDSNPSYARIFPEKSELLFSRCAILFDAHQERSRKKYRAVGARDDADEEIGRAH